MKPKMILPVILILVNAHFAIGQKENDRSGQQGKFVQISTENPFYFQLSTGETYIPVGANICWARDIATMESYFSKLAANGGNFARIWLNHPLHEIETTFGKANEEIFNNIDRVLAFAEKNGIKVKMCIESFRQIEAEKSFFSKSQYHVSQGGPFNDMPSYIHSEEGRQVFLARLEHFRKRYGDHDVIFGWELWNEMNAIKSDGLWDWNEYMLPKVHAMFPKNLVMQSLGSFDHESARKDYRYINRMESNDVAQIHRYLDLGASLDICKAPMDELSADAIDELRSYHVQKPLLLAEVGGVKPKHTGPIELYEQDKDGILLHDLLFAPFFAGSAGPGHAWHWDNYIDKNDLWYHFQRFNESIKGIDPVKEHFIPFRLSHPDLKIYGLAGRNTIILWCRDAENNWENEFVKQVSPRMLKDIKFDLASFVSSTNINRISVYDPWNDKWSNGKGKSEISLPAFRRSVVVRIEKK
jgi:hypothetical protein